MKSRWLVAGVLIWTTTLAFAAEAGFNLQVKAYVHTPEVFADRDLGFLPTDTQIPIGAPYESIWYVRYLWHLSFAEMPELVKIVTQWKTPGIDLSGQRDIFDEDLRALSDLTELRYLNLSGTRVSDRGLIYLYPLQNLEVLLLNDQITDKGLANIVRHPRLVELSLARSQVTNKGMEVVTGFEQLERLDLGNTKVADSGLKAIEKLRLQQLRLGPQVTDAGMKSLSNMATLEQLDLSQTQVTDMGLRYLAGKPRFHTLFAARHLTDWGLRALSKLTTLRRLDVTGASITDEGVKNLASLKDLEELALSQTSVGDTLMASLLALKHLQYLEISDTRVTLAGLKTLVGLASLQVLSFSSKGKLTLGDLKPLGHLPQLHAIIVNGKPITREALEYLKGRAPKPNSSQGVWRSFVPEVEAATGAVNPLNDAIDVASVQQGEGLVSGEKYTGLQRIHHVESELDEVISAPTMIQSDNQQDTDKNFLGEFSIGANGTVHRKTKASE